MILSSDRGGVVGICDAVTGVPLRAPLVGNTDVVNAVVVGRAGNRDVIISGGGDGRAVHSRCS